MTTATATRPLFEIAREIRQLWRPVNFAARPYLDAMAALNSIADRYGCDPGDEIVLRFLGNARAWRGEDAKRIKAELREML